MNWKKFKEEKPSEGEEVLAYHPSWIDEDFNPRGIRIGFWNGGDDFKSAHWWDYQDCYITISHCMNTEFENMALLNIEDYNELKAKAEATDEQIKKQAEEMAKPEVVTLKVCFDTYGLLYRPNTCVDVEIPFYDDEKNQRYA